MCVVGVYVCVPVVVCIRHYDVRSVTIRAIVHRLRARSFDRPIVCSIHVCDTSSYSIRYLWLPFRLATPPGFHVTHIPKGTLYVYEYLSFFLFSGISLRARILVRNVGWGGTIRPSRSRCRRFWRDSCSVSRVASIFNFWPWTHLRQIHGFPQHPRGLIFCIPYPRVGTYDLDANRVFCS